MSLAHASSYRTASRTGGLLVAAALALAAPAAAQHAHHGHAPPPAGLRAELIQGMDAIAQRYLALADALTTHFDWRPGDGVRSTSEVFMHVAAANFWLPTMAGVALPEGVTMDEVRGLEQVTEPARVRDALERSFRHLGHAIASTPDDALDDPVTLFGRDATKRAVLVLLANHAHEHLGQAIAYARTNGVTPPWSGD